MFEKIRNYLGLKTNALLYLILLMSMMIFALIVITIFINPELNPFAPKCFLFTKTGILCPLCGGQRSLFYLIQGDFNLSWQHNPLVVLSPLLVSSIIFIKVFLSHRVKNEILWFGLLFGMIVFFILRNII